MKKLLFLFFLTIIVKVSFGQSYSEHTDIRKNPAIAGHFRNDKLRTSFNYRQSLKSGSTFNRLTGDFSVKNKFGFGINLEYYKVPEMIFSDWYKLYLPFSYLTKPFNNKKHNISFGLMYHYESIQISDSIKYLDEGNFHITELNSGILYFYKNDNSTFEPYFGFQNNHIYSQQRTGYCVIKQNVHFSILSFQNIYGGCFIYLNKYLEINPFFELEYLVYGADIKYTFKVGSIRFGYSSDDDKDKYLKFGFEYKGIEILLRTYVNSYSYNYYGNYGLLTLRYTYLNKYHKKE